MKIIEQIESFFSSKVYALKTFFSIFKLEVQLAGLSIFPLLINVCMLFVILITLWLSSMTLLGYFAVQYFGNFFKPLCLIILLNSVSMLGLVKYLTYNLNNMSFKKTRSYFASQENNIDDELEKKTTQPASSDGKKLTEASSASSS